MQKPHFAFVANLKASSENKRNMCNAIIKQFGILITIS